MYRSLFTLTCGYVLLQFAISVVGFLLITFYGTLLWAAAGWSLLVLIFALVYLRDLYLIFMEGEVERQQGESGRQCDVDAN